MFAGEPIAAGLAWRCPRAWSSHPATAGFFFVERFNMVGFSIGGPAGPRGWRTVPSKKVARRGPATSGRRALQAGDGRPVRIRIPRPAENCKMGAGESTGRGRGGKPAALLCVPLRPLRFPGPHPNSLPKGEGTFLADPLNPEP